jgi:uncharacterized protein (TIGR03067 family)
VVYVWERKEQAMAVGKQTKSDQDKIQGTWRVVNFCLPGVKQDEMLAAIWDHFKKQTTTFSGDEVHIDTGIPNQSVEPARFKLSPEHGPKQIDLIALRDANNPKDNLWGPGIYKFEDDKLWVCIAPPGGKRPSDFSTKDGADQSGLLVLERVPGKANYQGPAVPAQARKAIPLGRTWSGSHSGETKPEQIVVRTEKEWALVWKKSQDSRELLTPPKVDFDKEMVLAVFLGSKPSGGHAIAITEVACDKLEMSVQVRTTLPTGNGAVELKETRPYCLVVVQRFDGVISFLRAVGEMPAAAAVEGFNPMAVGPQGFSSTKRQRR